VAIKASNWNFNVSLLLIFMLILNKIFNQSGFLWVTRSFN